MTRTFCAVIKDPTAAAVLAPWAAEFGRAKRWAFREHHVKGRPVLAVRKDVQSRFGMTKRHALGVEFDLKQEVAAWRGTQEH